MRTRYRTKIESLDEIRAVLPNADLTPHPEAGPATPQQLYLLSRNRIACEIDAYQAGVLLRIVVTRRRAGLATLPQIIALARSGHKTPALALNEDARQWLQEHAGRNIKTTRAMA